jgi:hypothetical protein
MPIKIAQLCCAEPSYTNPGGRETLTRLCPQTCAKQSCCFTNEIPQALVQTGPIHLHLAPKTLLCCWALEPVLPALQTLQLVDHLTWQLRSPLRRRTLTENNKDYSDWENSDEGLNTSNGGTLKYIHIYIYMMWHSSSSTQKLHFWQVWQISHRPIEVFVSRTRSQVEVHVRLCVSSLRSTKALFRRGISQSLRLNQTSIIPRMWCLTLHSQFLQSQLGFSSAFFSAKQWGIPMPGVVQALMPLQELPPLPCNGISYF